MRQSHPEIYGSAYKRAKRGSSGVYKDVGPGKEVAAIDVYGPYGWPQYESLIAAYRLDEEAALQACSWGKFQIMGFNYRAAGFDSLKAFTAAMSLGDAEHMKAFLKFSKNNPVLLDGRKRKNFEKIAAGHNGSEWRSINPDYEKNTEKFYNECAKFNR